MTESAMEKTRRLFNENGEELKQFNREHPPKDSFLKNFLIAFNNHGLTRLFNSVSDGCFEKNPRNRNQN